MSVYLNSLQIALFFRSKFEDEDKFFKYMLDCFNPVFENCAINKIPSFPDLPEEIPLITAVSKNGVYIFQLSKMRIDIIFRMNIESEKYDSYLNDFLMTNKKAFSKINYSDNLCTRIGIVESSFYFDENPIKRIANTFFKPKKFVNCNDIKISYNQLKKLSNGKEQLNINNVNTLEIGKLKMPTEDIQNGIIIRKDINTIPKGKIDFTVIDQVFNYASKEMTKDKTMETLNGK